ncbi:MAG: TonB-dependent receptor [Leadbetterella sp.]|nr:TonB-dependent receptor [Leadbetterella sp.]
MVFNGKRVVNAGGAQTTVEDIKETNTYNAFLPMVHLKHNFNERTIVRAAFTRSFARPDFNSLNPGTIVSEIANTITEGNTELKPTFSNNLDLMIDYYFKDVGAFTVGGFYKKLSHVIYDNQSVVELNNRNYILSRPENLESAWVAGFELGFSKRFSGLPGVLGKMGFEGNYSFVDSKVAIPQFENGKKTGEISSTLPKQAKNIFNTILFYEDNSLMLRVAGNYKGNYLNVIRSSAGPEHYQWFDKNFTVDFSAAYSFTPALRAFLELNNMTNEPNRFYHGDKKRVESLTYNSFRGQIGINFQIK